MIKIMARKSLDGITKRASHNLGDTPPRRRASTQPVRRRNLGAYGDESVAIDRIVRDKRKSRRQSSREDFLKPVDVFDFDESDVEELQAADDRRHHRSTSKKPKKKWSRKRKIITFSILGLILTAIIFVIAIIVCFISPLSAISPIAVFLTAIGISGGITYFYYRVKKSKDIRPSHYKHYVLRRGFPILTAIEKKKFAKKVSILATFLMVATQFLETKESK